MSGSASHAAVAGAPRGIAIVGTGAVAQAIALAHAAAGGRVIVISRERAVAARVAESVAVRVAQGLGSGAARCCVVPGTLDDLGAFRGVPAEHPVDCVDRARDVDSSGAAGAAADLSGPSEPGAARCHAAAGEPGDRDTCEPPSVVIVAVPDQAVPEVGLRLRAAGFGGLILHTSGALPGSSLGPRGTVGSLHPLQSFPTTASLADLGARSAGAHWFHEGDGEAVARTLVAAWGGVFHTIAPGGKALYHAGAVVLSNHAVALYADAVLLFASAGIDPIEGSAALATLLLGTASNVAALGVPAALTGPVARGDVATVVRHLNAMVSVRPDLVPSYVEMARRAAVVARQKGTLDAAASADLERALNDAGSGSQAGLVAAPR